MSWAWSSHGPRQQHVGQRTAQAGVELVVDHREVVGVQRRADAGPRRIGLAVAVAAAAAEQQREGEEQEQDTAHPATL